MQTGARATVRGSKTRPLRWEDKNKTLASNYAMWTLMLVHWGPCCFLRQSKGTASRVGRPTCAQRPTLRPRGVPTAQPHYSVPGDVLQRRSFLTLKLLFLPLHHSCFPRAQTLLKTPLFHFDQTHFGHENGL